VGTANAAVLLSLAAEHIDIDALVLLGVGGALDPRLEVGDTVISKKIIQHDSISSDENRTKFIAPGELTLSVSEDQQVDPIMKCDEVLLGWVRKGKERKGKERKGIELGHQGKTYEGT
jgi:nucleoside phosphorylase